MGLHGMVWINFTFHTVREWRYEYAMALFPTASLKDVEKILFAQHEKQHTNTRLSVKERPRKEIENKSDKM